MKKLKKYLKRIIKLIKLDEMEILPGHLAFYLIFILIPIISFIGIISNQVNLELTELVINENIPKAVSELIISALNLNLNNYNLILFTIISLWLASRGSKAIIISSNLLFKIKEKDNLKIRIRAIFMTIVLFMLVVFIVLVPVLGDIIFNFFSGYLKDSAIIVVTKVYHALKYPISLVLMFILIKTLYTIAPTKKIKSKFMNNGAIWTTVMWFFLSRIYSFYLNNYNNYNLYYGGLSNILILLVWIYLLSYIFTIGLSLNADDYLSNYKTQDY